MKPGIEAVPDLDSRREVRLMLGYLCAATEAEASIERKVQILDRFGLPDKEIAIICGCAMQSVRNARRSLKVSNAKGRKKS